LIQAQDDTRALFHRTLAFIGVFFCLGIIAVVGHTIWRSYRSRLEPPQSYSFASIPVQIGEKSVMLGVGIVSWQVPPELEAAFIQAGREDAKRQLEALTLEFQRQLDAFIRQQANPAPSSPGAASPGAPNPPPAPPAPAPLP
jgi:hypothetical protein